MSGNVRFSPNQLKFIEWLATPKIDRVPGTQELLAERLAVSPRTLYRWKNDQAVQAAVTERARELLNDDLPEIYGALRREAIKGNFQHLKLALEMLGEYTEKLDHGGDFTITVNYGDRANSQPSTTSSETD